MHLTPKKKKQLGNLHPFHFQPQNRSSKWLMLIFMPIEIQQTLFSPNYETRNPFVPQADETLAAKSFVWRSSKLPLSAPKAEFPL